MGVTGQQFEVGHAVVTGPGREYVGEGQRGQGGEAARAPPSDDGPPAVDQAALIQPADDGRAVLDVGDAPLTGQQLTVGAAVPGTAPVINVRDRESAVGPV